jgi:hypothetical protein
MSTNESLDRRDFLKSVSATGLTLTAATSSLAAKSASKTSGGRVIGANDRINVGVIGCGRGAYDASATSAFAQSITTPADRRRLRRLRSARRW